jgi:hypothetical protein
MLRDREGGMLDVCQTWGGKNVLVRKDHMTAPALVDLVSCLSSFSVEPVYRMIG